MEKVNGASCVVWIAWCNVDKGVSNHAHTPLRAVLAYPWLLAFIVQRSNRIISPVALYLEQEHSRVTPFAPNISGIVVFRGRLHWETSTQGEGTLEVQPATVTLAPALTPLTIRNKPLFPEG